MIRKVTEVLIVACLVWGLTPGLAVAAENLWHVATTGYVAHVPVATDPGDDHDPVDSEHGCTGAFHFCFCHHSLMSAPTPVVTCVPTGALPERAACSEGRAPRAPVLSGLERPPRS